MTNSWTSAIQEMDQDRATVNDPKQWVWSIVNLRQTRVDHVKKMTVAAKINMVMAVVTRTTMPSWPWEHRGRLQIRVIVRRNEAVAPQVHRPALVPPTTLEEEAVASRIDQDGLAAVLEGLVSDRAALPIAPVWEP
jgi:hypothetical protein